MDEAVRARLEQVVGAEPTAAVELSGGLVGTVYRVTFAERPPLAVKIGDTPLDLEARMLRYLAAESPLPVPAVHHAESDLLVLAFVTGDQTWTAVTERDVADHLVALHEVSADAFGFSFETLSGPYTQPNPWAESWIAFFRDHRLLHFAERAHEEGTLPESTLARVRTLAEELDDLLVEPAQPSLLHGDLWAGNLVVEDESLAAALDPALYYGHDELELAYIEGSAELGEAFFERYRERRGIDDGYPQRRAVYRVFHVLENVRFFGAKRIVPELDEALTRVGV